MTEHEPERAPEHGGQVSREEFSRLESMVQTVLNRLPLTHDRAEQATERRLDRPSSVEEQIEAAKRQAKAELKAEQDAAKVRSELDDHRKQLAAMQEKPPAEAVDWRAKWWS